MMLPAHPGTHVLTKEEDGSVSYEPVIYWLVNDEGHPVPHTIDGHRRVLDDSAILFPDGRVLPGFESTALLSIAEWAGGKAAATPARPAQAAQKAPTAPVVSSALPFEMKGKKYARKSFWQIDDGECQMVFELDADVNSPVGDAVSKITREEFKSSTFPTQDVDKLYSLDGESEEDDDDFGDMV